jgi:tRNA pseudouridine55 synthase
MDGLLVLNKPAGPTSHDAVARVRRALGEQRIGHTGTLDPSASGVLPLVLGRATRLARFLSAGDKTYEAVVRLGIATDTYDAEGQPSAPSTRPLPSRPEIERALEGFRGTFLQRPPAFSAKKVRGRRSHELARAARRQSREPLEPLEPRESEAPEPLAPLEPLEPVSVTVKALDLLSVDGDRVALRITCSAGFYVRSLAHDLGEQLGVGGHLVSLTRTRSGDATLAGALTLDAVEREPARASLAIVPLSAMLPALCAVVLTPEGLLRARHGSNLGPADFDGPPPHDTWIRLVDSKGQLVGLAERTDAPGVLHPSVVLM